MEVIMSGPLFLGLHLYKIINIMTNYIKKV